MLGDLSLLPADVRESLRRTEEMTRDNTSATLNVCICYSGTDELDEALTSTPSDVEDFNSRL